MPVSLPPGFVAVTGPTTLADFADTLAAPATTVTSGKEPSMALSFKSVGHMFATFFHAVGTGVAKLESTETSVETATAAIPGAAPAVTIEKAAYAVLGEVASILNTGGEAVEAKLTDAGLDSAVVTQVKGLLGSVSQVAALAKAVDSK